MHIVRDMGVLVCRQRGLRIWNPTNRARSAEHVVGAREWFNPRDGERMIEVTLKTRGICTPSLTEEAQCKKSKSPLNSLI